MSPTPWNDRGGDPIVLYDAIADRWILSEIGDGPGSTAIEVYVSVTGDPVSGGWAYYGVGLNQTVDYPKLAVWPSAYFVTSFGAAPPGTFGTAAAMDRAAMLTGSPAYVDTIQIPRVAPRFDAEYLTPADLDGATLPPAGSPGFLLGHVDDEYHVPATPGSDSLLIWEYDFDFATFTRTLNGPFYVTVGEFDSVPANVPEPSGGQLDPMMHPVMWRLQYRNFVDHEALVGSFTTNVGAGGHGIRWFELRREPAGSGSWVPYQEGTFAPDAEHRWLPSIGMDACGNIGVVYNVSSDVVYPGIRYAGRTGTDPLGTLPQGESSVIEGTSSQLGIARWGDYAALSIDETDQCTFWVTGEYELLLPTNNFQWRTRIASFRFPNCRPEVPSTSLRVVRDSSDGVRLDWEAVPTATAYNVYRGDIDSLFTARVYNHAASTPLGEGECGVIGTFDVDDDDVATVGDFYYIVTAKSCIFEGVTGYDSFGNERPPGTGCP